MPISPASFLICSSLCRIFSSSDSSPSARSTALSSSRRRLRVSSNFRSGSTCSTTLAGSKSSIEENLSLTGISLPSSASVFSTRNSSPGVIRRITSSNESRSMETNLRSLSGLRGSVGFPENSPITPTTNGRSFTTTAPSVSTSYVIWTRGLRTRDNFCCTDSGMGLSPRPRPDGGPVKMEGKRTADDRKPGKF